MHFFFRRTSRFILICLSDKRLGKRSVPVAVSQLGKFIRRKAQYFRTQNAYKFRIPVPVVHKTQQVHKNLDFYGIEISLGIVHITRYAKFFHRFRIHLSVSRYRPHQDHYIPEIYFFSCTYLFSVHRLHDFIFFACVFTDNPADFKRLSLSRLQFFQNFAGIFTFRHVYEPDLRRKGAFAATPIPRIKICFLGVVLHYAFESVVHPVQNGGGAPEILIQVDFNGFFVRPARVFFILALENFRLRQTKFIYALLDVAHHKQIVIPRNPRYDRLLKNICILVLVDKNILESVSVILRNVLFFQNIKAEMLNVAEIHNLFFTLFFGKKPIKIRQHTLYRPGYRMSLLQG